MKKVLALVLTAVMMFSLTATAFANVVLDDPAGGQTKDVGDVEANLAYGNSAVNAQYKDNTINVSGNVTAGPSDNVANDISGVSAVDGAIVNVDGDVKLTGGATSSSELDAVCAVGGSTEDSKSEVNVTGDVIMEFQAGSHNEDSAGVSAINADVDVGNVTVSGGNSTNNNIAGIEAFEESTVTAGDVTVDAGDNGSGNCGIEAIVNSNVTAGDVTVDGGKNGYSDCGIEATENSNVTAGDVTVTGDHSLVGIYATNSDIKAGKVTVDGTKEDNTGVEVAGKSNVTVDGISVSGSDGFEAIRIHDDEEEPTDSKITIISNGDVCVDGEGGTAIHLDENIDENDAIQIVIHGDLKAKDDDNFGGRIIGTNSDKNISDAIDSSAVDIYVESITVGDEIGSIMANGVAIGEDGMLEADNDAGAGSIAFLKEILHYIVDASNVQLLSGFDKNENETFGFDYSAQLESNVTFKAENGYELDESVLKENGYENYYTKNSDGSYTLTVRYFGGLVFKANLIPVAAATDEASSDGIPGYTFTLKKDVNDKSRGRKFAFAYDSADALLYVGFGETQLVKGEDYTVTESDGQIIVEITEDFFAKYQRDTFDIVLLFSDGTTVCVVVEKE